MRSNCGIYRVVYGRWKNWGNGGEVISHSPAPDYLRFDARLVQAAAREIALSELVEILENHPEHVYEWNTCVTLYEDEY